MYFKSLPIYTLFLVITLFFQVTFCGSVGGEKIPDDIYWAGQQKYLVNPATYYGSMPSELELAVLKVNNPQVFQKAGLAKTSNFIFYGPPGVGKTFVGSIFAQKIKADFMYVQGGELLDGYVGGGMRMPEQLFKRARDRRDATGRLVVMFIDEIDAVVGSRNRNVSQCASDIQLIGTLLKEIGSPVNDRIIVIAATNRIYSVDGALLRSGRFEHHIRFDFPNQQDRKNFLLFITKPYSYIFADTINWDDLAKVLVGCTYADLNKIINDIKEDFVVERLKNPTLSECKIENLYVMNYVLRFQQQHKQTWFAVIYSYLTTLWR